MDSSVESVQNKPLRDARSAKASGTVPETAKWEIGHNTKQSAMQRQKR
jgi:hypothetical protein